MGEISACVLCLSFKNETGSSGLLDGVLSLWTCPPLCSWSVNGGLSLTSEAAAGLPAHGEWVDPEGPLHSEPAGAGVQPSARLLTPRPLPEVPRTAATRGLNPGSLRQQGLEVSVSEIGVLGRTPPAGGLAPHPEDLGGGPPSLLQLLVAASVPGLVAASLHLCLRLHGAVSSSVCVMSPTGSLKDTGCCVRVISPCPDP